MKFLPCPVCGASRELAFSAVVLDHHRVEYVKCQGCGFLAADEPSWLDEAYQSAIADVDSGVLARVRDLVPRLVCLLRLTFPPGAVYADIGGGYGVLVRAMRDVGLDFRWSDPHCPNLLARGFELGSERCAAVTAVEVLEHAVDPLAFLEEALERTEASVAFVTTEVLPVPVPDPASWWYYAFPTGQHVSFFERRTLEVLAGRLRLRLHSRRNLHVFHRGDVKRSTFLIAGTRLAPTVARILRRSIPSLTEADNPLLGGTDGVGTAS